MGWLITFASPRSSEKCICRIFTCHPSINSADILLDILLAVPSQRGRGGVGQAHVQVLKNLIKCQNFCPNYGQLKKLHTKDNNSTHKSIHIPNLFECQRFYKLLSLLVARKVVRWDSIAQQIYQTKLRTS